MSSEPVSSPTENTTRHAGRILVIDDEENIRSTLEEFLSLTGYEVDTASSGAEGLDRLGASHYDLVLSDLKMPGVDGIAVIEWIKETRPDLPVLVMTGFATVESTIRALRLGAQDYLLKPFSLDEIERTIDNCLEKQRLKERNTELTEANQRLRDIERIKDDLLATVSHEFRTPLTSMKGFLTLLQQQDLENLRSDQLHALQAIGDNTERLDRMIANLLTLVESQDGSYHLMLEPVTFGVFLDEYLSALAETRDLQSLEVDVPTEVRNTDVLLDRMRFPLALSNLIDNAFKFCAAPGEAEVVLRARTEGRQLQLEVHDNGIGIAEALGDRIFERFTQGDMTATREFQGAGLGLATVQVVVNAHGGRTRLIPPMLGGASVRVSIPLAEAK